MPPGRTQEIKSSTLEIMTGIPLPLCEAWSRTEKDLRYSGWERAWQLAKRHPEFWVAFSKIYPKETPRKTVRFQLPQNVYEYVMHTKSVLSVPVSHIIAALLYLAFTDLSNALYTKELRLSPSHETKAA